LCIVTWSWWQVLVSKLGVYKLRGLQINETTISHSQNIWLQLSDISFAGLVSPAHLIWWPPAGIVAARKACYLTYSLVLLRSQIRKQKSSSKSVKNPRITSNPSFRRRYFHSKHSKHLYMKLTNTTNISSKSQINRMDIGSQRSKQTSEFKIYTNHLVFPKQKDHAYTLNLSSLLALCQGCVRVQEVRKKVEIWLN